MRFPIPELPENFDDGLREPSEMEMADTQRSLMLDNYESLLSDLLLYFAVGHLAHEEHQGDDLSDSHPIADAGLALQTACSELYDGLRSAEAAVGPTENIDIAQFAVLIKEGDLDATDMKIIESRNDLEQAWSSFQGIAEDRVEAWLSEADSRLADIG